MTTADKDPYALPQFITRPDTDRTDTEEMQRLYRKSLRINQIEERDPHKTIIEGFIDSEPRPLRPIRDIHSFGHIDQGDLFDSAESARFRVVDVAPVTSDKVLQISGLELLEFAGYGGLKRTVVKTPEEAKEVSLEDAQSAAEIAIRFAQATPEAGMIHDYRLTGDPRLDSVVELKSSRRTRLSYPVLSFDVRNSLDVDLEANQQTFLYDGNTAFNRIGADPLANALIYLSQRPSEPEPAQSPADNLAWLDHVEG